MNLNSVLHISESNIQSLQDHLVEVAEIHDDRSDEVFFNFKIALAKFSDNLDLNNTLSQKGFAYIRLKSKACLQQGKDTAIPAETGERSNQSAFCINYLLWVSFFI
jgi:actin-related protein